MSEHLTYPKAKKFLYIFVGTVCSVFILFILACVAIIWGLSIEGEISGEQYDVVNRSTQYGRVIHKETEADIISPYVITYGIEKNHLYGARIPFSRTMACKEGATEATGSGYDLRIEYFILNLDAPPDDARASTPIFHDWASFERALIQRDFYEYETFDHDYVIEWLKIGKKRNYGGECFGQGPLPQALRSPAVLPDLPEELERKYRPSSN